MAKTKIAALLGVLALLTSLPLTVALAQEPPYLVFGTAMVDEEPAKNGTEVVAMVGDEVVGSGEVFNDQGQYRLLITGGNQGDTLTISLIVLTAYIAVADVGNVVIGNPGDLKTTNLTVSTSTVSTNATGEEPAPVSRPASEVFSGLGDRLERVWQLDRATQTWKIYDPDPGLAVFNTLTEVSSGDVVTLMVSQGSTVRSQGYTLYPGVNPIALD